MDSTQVLVKGMVAAVQAKPEIVAKIQDIYQFKITGADPLDFSLTFKDGRMIYAEGQASDPDVTLIMSFDAFAGLMTGQLNPLKALTTKKLDVDGDLMKVIVFSQFLA